jgi:predicted TIM-barrel fold metal-dependent hydrolase
MEMFPRLRAVAAHLGGYRAWDDALEYLAGNERIMYDTSSALWAMTPEYADYVVGKLGSEHVMFGTDYPVMNTDEELNRLFKLKLTEQQKELLEKYDDRMHELYALFEREVFMHGFKMGAKILAGVLVEDTIE